MTSLDGKAIAGQAITRSRWLGAALVTGMVLSGYVLGGYLLIRALLWLLDQAGRAGW